MRKLMLAFVLCSLMMAVSCTQQVTETKPLPAEIKIGEKYHFAYSFGTGNVTVLETSNGWVKIRDAKDQIAWINPDAIVSISEYKGN